MGLPTIIPKMFNFQGKSGQLYSFIQYELDDPPTYSGIYIVARTELNLFVIYIGEAENIRDRLSNHEKRPCFENEGANLLFTMNETSNVTRLSIETDLRNFYQQTQAPCNKQPIPPLFWGS